MNTQPQHTDENTTTPDGERSATPHGVVQYSVDGVREALQMSPDDRRIVDLESMSELMARNIELQSQQMEALQKTVAALEARLAELSHYAAVRADRLVALQREAAEARLVQGGVPFSRTKETLLVVSHEASRTGAPILSLNLVRHFARTYNVVAIVLGGGPLLEAFSESSVSMASLERGATPKQISDTVIAVLAAFDIKYAVVNSLESATVLETLSQASVPSVLLVHEFAAYTRPRWKFTQAMFWADEVVFSTQMTYRSVIDDNLHLAGRHCRFVPQGRCVLEHEERSEAVLQKELARVRSTLRPPEARDAFLVVGIGTVQMRKGVEYFIACAAKALPLLKGRPCRFVWVGHGYEPEWDVGYSAYLADQIKQSGLEGKLHFLDDTFLVEEVYEHADLLLLTSRLDPLPGVAIEAMSHELPVLCFDRTTGIADVLREHGFAKECVVPYLDVEAMTQQLVRLAKSEALRERLGAGLKRVADSYFDMASYIRSLDALGEEAIGRHREEVETAAAIQRSGLVRRDFLVPGSDDRDELELIHWKYVRPARVGFQERKPFPGFHPGVYRMSMGPALLGDPLLHFAESGSPTGPWLTEVLSSEDTMLPADPSLRVALHVHAHYADLLPEVFIRLGLNRLLPDVFVSASSQEALDAAKELLKSYKGRGYARRVPNRGRDIGPFITAFGTELFENFDVVGHVHTKKSTAIGDHEFVARWRTFLMENLLGCHVPMTDLIVGRMSADESIGLVFPDDPNIEGWGKNLEIAERLCPKLGIPGALPPALVFPVGNMFWMRAKAMRPLLDLRLDWEDYPSEPLPYDGTMLHALERLLPRIVESQGYRSVVTNVKGLTR